MRKLKFKTDWDGNMGMITCSDGETRETLSAIYFYKKFRESEAYLAVAGPDRMPWEPQFRSVNVALLKEFAKFAEQNNIALFKAKTSFRPEMRAFLEKMHKKGVDLQDPWVRLDFSKLKLKKRKEQFPKESKPGKIGTFFAKLNPFRRRRGKG